MIGLVLALQYIENLNTVSGLFIMLRIKTLCLRYIFMAHEGCRHGVECKTTRPHGVVGRVNVVLINPTLSNQMCHDLTQTSV